MTAAIGIRFDCSNPLKEALSRVALGECPRPGTRGVAIRVLAAPVNIADLAVIKGTYPIKQVDSFPGIEGFGIVEACGGEVSGLKPGDYVVPALSSLGMWRKHFCCQAEDVVALPASQSTIDAIIRVHGLAALATLNSSAATAYHFLRDSPQCSTVLQTSANSFLGRLIIQLAKAWGIRTINVVRNADYKAELLALGADNVLTYEELGGGKDLPYDHRPDRALCTVGDAANKLASALRTEGELIIISCVDGKPIQLAFPDIVFRNITVKGFWMSQWYQKSMHDESMQSDRRKMLAELLSLYNQGKLIVPPHKYVSPEEIDILEATPFKKIIKFT